MAYMYRHIRLDKNVPFYIGIGSDNLGKYKRAYSKKSRNSYWKNIANMCDYVVEIMLDDLSWEEACEKEKEFIQLYGREDLKFGPLVNHTDGGEGTINMNIESKMRMINKLKKLKRPERSLEYRKNISKAKSGKNNPMYGKPSHRAKPVLKYDLNDVFICEYSHSYEAALDVKGNHSHIAACCRNQRNTHKKFKWKFK